MDWHSVLIAAGVGLAAIIAAVLSGLRGVILTWFNKAQRRMNRATYMKQIEKIAKFLEVLESARTIQEVDSLVVYHGHNCGGMPSPGGQYTVKAVHAWARNGTDPLDMYGFDQQVDLHYVKLLEDMIKTGFSIQQFQFMAEAAKLRSYFALEGVKHARFYFLGIVDTNEVIFVCFSSYTNDFNDLDKRRMEIYVDQIRSLLEFE